jgi:hypothetical protein
MKFFWKHYPGISALFAISIATGCSSGKPSILLQYSAGNVLQNSKLFITTDGKVLREDSQWRYNLPPMITTTPVGNIEGSKDLSMIREWSAAMPTSDKVLFNPLFPGRYPANIDTRHTDSTDVRESKVRALVARLLESPQRK